MIPSVPTGTAMIVYVSDDGTIIDAVDVAGAPLAIASPELDTLSGTKFVAAGETAEKVSAALLPSEQDAPATRSISSATAQKTVTVCCYCMIGGKLYCRSSCC
jgi:hypothetical protein